MGWKPSVHDEDHAARHADGGADELDAADLASGAATDGQVLTADGAGGAAWEDLPAGGGSIPDVGTTKGDLAVYDGADWVRVGVGSDDQVLTADSGESAGVGWADAAGGGGSAGPVVAMHLTASPITGGFSGSAFAYKGNVIVPMWSDVAVRGGMAWINVGSGFDYRLILITFSGSTVTSVDATADTSPAGSGPMMVEFDFGSEYTVAKGATNRALLVGRYDGAGNYVLPVQYNGGLDGFNRYPNLGIRIPSSPRIAQASPAASDSIDTAATDSVNSLAIVGRLDP